MMPSATSRNFRPSRRFACDRCRNFKLRCQRDESLGEACERCARARLACTTTFEHPSSSSAAQRLSLPDGVSSHPHQPNGHGIVVEQAEARAEVGTTAAAAAGIVEPRPSPPDERGAPVATGNSDNSHSRFEPNLSQPQRHSPSSPNGGHHEPNGATGVVRNTLPSPSIGGRARPPTTASRLSGGLEVNGQERHAGADTGDCMLVVQNNALGLDGMDFAMPDIPFDAGDYDLALLMGGHQPSPRSHDAGIRVAVSGRDRRGGSDGVAGIFDHHNGVGLNGGPANDVLNWPSLAHNGSMGDGSSSSAIEIDRSHEPPFVGGANGDHQQQQQQQQQQNHHQSHSLHKPSILQAPGCYIDIIKLHLELVEDQNIIETQAPLDAPHPVPDQNSECTPAEQSRYINRVLNQSARFWDMLKSMSLAAEAQSGRRAGSPSTSNASSNASSSGYNLVSANGNGHASNRGGGSNGGNGSSSSDGRVDSSVWRGWTRAGSSGSANSSGGGAGRVVDLDLYISAAALSTTNTSAHHHPHPHQFSHNQHPRADHVLVVNLVMTYVYLLRNSRAVLARLLQALEMAPTAEARSPLRLPSLQFGDFQLDNNLAIQVKVLVEMMSGMLLRIGNTLGISPAGVIVPADGNASPPAEDRDCRLPFMSDPVAISLREVILSQERVQGGGGAAAHAGEAPPLSEIMASLRRLLGRRYSVV